MRLTDSGITAIVVRMGFAALIGFAVGNGHRTAAALHGSDEWWREACHLRVLHDVGHARTQQMVKDWNEMLAEPSPAPPLRSDTKTD